MTAQEWLLFILTVLGVSLIPGPSTLLAFADGARFGADRAVATALGNACASTLQAAAASVGLGAIIVGSALLFSIVKYAGAAYLVYIGIRMWRAAHVPIVLGAGTTRPSRTATALFRGGFAVAIANPKAIAFFTALFRQFLSHEGGTVTQLAGMTAICGAGAFLVAMTYSVFGDRVRQLELSQGLMIGLQRSVGGMFFLSGVGIAFARTEE
ncbi:LysE family translocator [Aestuariibius sp. 2305UL40-4]|uniref:LysE family translocator n=1 Tax=Aestuariibius violaceus TaxID=3234132 RepID=UPI00345E3C4A